jgi:hypothetical protein
MSKPVGPQKSKGTSAISNPNPIAAPSNPKVIAESIAWAAGWRPRCDMCQSNFNDFDPKLSMRCHNCCQVLVDWDGASDWSYLLDYNRDFIEGARTATPYSTYRLFEDESIHNGILRLHDYGIMVVDAQPDYHKIGQDKGGKWFEIKERAYLRCVIPSNLASVPTTKIETMLDMLIEAPHLETVMYYEYVDYFAGKWLKDELGYRCAPPTTARKVDVREIPRFQYFRSSIGSSLTGRTPYCEHERGASLD